MYLLDTSVLQLYQRPDRHYIHSLVEDYHNLLRLRLPIHC
ncbi:hypothetical protein H8S90_20305 [Olivibacter sp. SDN3]|nr:hypothetical protein H8S90_20305 [Olivibacter sp. SDN3]